MATKSDPHWMEKAFANAHGQLRRATHTKAGQKISARKLSRESKSGSTKMKRRANLVRIAERSNHKRG